MSNEIAKAMNLTPLIPNRPALKAIKSDDEYQSAKGNLDTAMNVAVEAIADVVELARSAQDARAYRVLNELLTTVVNASKVQMEMKQIQTDVKQKEEGNNPQTVNQNLYISTTELAALINKKKIDNT